MYSGGTSFMPLRVNYSGVMPIIFAQSILMFPQTIFLQLGNFVSVPFLKNLFIGIAQNLNSGSVLYLVIYSLMILFFAYFWVATQFNELQIADDLKKNGGYIPGVRPGQGTSDYLHKSMSRITLAGAIFLMVIATIPIILSRQMSKMCIRDRHEADRGGARGDCPQHEAARENVDSHLPAKVVHEEAAGNAHGQGQRPAGIVGGGDPPGERAV